MYGTQLKKKQNKKNKPKGNDTERVKGVFLILIR